MPKPRPKPKPMAKPKPKPKPKPVKFEPVSDEDAGEEIGISFDDLSSAVRTKKKRT